VENTHVARPKRTAIQRLLDGWRARRQFEKEMAGCDSSEVDRMLQDLGLTREDMDAVMHAQLGPQHLLLSRLEREGLDPEKLMRFEAAVFRDLQRVCAHCGSTGRCERDLDHADDRNWKHYCPNADTIEALTASRKEG